INRLSTMLYFIIIYFSSSIVLLISGNENKTINQLSVNIDYTDNNTWILYYNLTTNYSYYLTFRLFEHEQIKYGLFPATYRYQQNSIQIFQQFNSSNKLFYLFIICFHFIHYVNDIDIQCKDIFKSNNNSNESDIEYLPTYKPMFVPLMYALSILMLLPVIIQHRRHKRAQIHARRKQIRRLSITLSQDNPNLLAEIVENESRSFKKIPIEIELVSLPSTKTMLDDIDDNDNVTFTLKKLRPFTEKYIDDYDEDDINESEEPSINADDCIAHLLDNTPWNSYLIDQSPMISSGKRQTSDVFKAQHSPIMTTFPNHSHDDDDNDQLPILKPHAHHTIDLFRSNPTYTESDV
ncbi:unnamed protein product, partial [Adineta steineri]